MSSPVHDLCTMFCSHHPPVTGARRALNRWATLTNPAEAGPGDRSPPPAPGYPALRGGQGLDALVECRWLREYGGPLGRRCQPRERTWRTPHWEAGRSWVQPQNCAGCGGVCLYGFWYSGVVVRGWPRCVLVPHEQYGRGESFVRTGADRRLAGGGARRGCRLIRRGSR